MGRGGLVREKIQNKGGRIGLKECSHRELKNAIFLPTRGDFFGERIVNFQLFGGSEKKPLTGTGHEVPSKGLALLKGRRGEVALMGLSSLRYFAGGKKKNLIKGVLHFRGDI